MWVKCCVPGCGTVRRQQVVKGEPFFTMPREIKKRNIWMSVLNVEEKDLKKLSLVCYKHFDKDDYFTFECKHRLKPGKIPKQNQAPMVEMIEIKEEFIIKEEYDD